MTNIIEVNNLHKSFKKNTVLNDLSFSVKKGSVVGVLGNNGAGKTTLIQTMLGFMKSDTGECIIFGEVSPNISSTTKHKIGYVPQEAELLNWMTVKQIIAYTKSFYQHWNDSLVQRLILDWQLNDSKVIETMSVGQKQKLAIILAMAHEPELLILDEPVASLDPSTRRHFIKELIELNLEDNRTILFSTHITSDLERVAAEVLIVKDGKNYFHGDIDDLKENVVKLFIQSESPIGTLPMINGLISQSIEGKHATLVIENASAFDIKILEQTLDAKVTIQQLSLEDIFVEIHA